MINIYLLGYEGLSVAEFFERLEGERIEVLVDVRQLALSRKRGFSKTPLSLAAHEAGIQYVAARDLGCPPTIRHAYQRHGDWATYVREYERYLAEHTDGLERVQRLARDRRVCLVCFEANPQRCHRSLIAKAIDSAYGGASIRDLRA